MKIKWWRIYGENSLKLNESTAACRAEAHLQWKTNSQWVCVGVEGISRVINQLHDQQQVAQHFWSVLSTVVSVSWAVSLNSNERQNELVQQVFEVPILDYIPNTHRPEFHGVVNRWQIDCVYIVLLQTTPDAFAAQTTQTSRHRWHGSPCSSWALSVTQAGRAKGR